MKQNLTVLRKSRPLVLATVGIAFFLFMTLFLRQSLLFQGETAEEIRSGDKTATATRRGYRHAPLDAVPIVPAQTPARIRPFASAGRDRRSQVGHTSCQRSRRR